MVAVIGRNDGALLGGSRAGRRGDGYADIGLAMLAFDQFAANVVRNGQDFTTPEVGADHLDGHT
jgi:hypothetical protein